MSITVNFKTGTWDPKKKKRTGKGVSEKRRNLEGANFGFSDFHGKCRFYFYERTVPSHNTKMRGDIFRSENILKNSSTFDKTAMVYVMCIGIHLYVCTFIH